MPYLSHTETDRRKMLASIGVGSIDELFKDVPEPLRIGGLSIPEGISEPEVLRLVGKLASENADLETRPSFLGGGSYFGYVPAGVGAITGRAEFYTSYTPYQAEMSQGTLQVIYEFQTMIAMLTGLDVANASLYEGATAVAEAASMALNATDRHRVAIVDSVNPDYRRVLKTYGDAIGYAVDTVPAVPVLDSSALASVLTDQYAALIVQNPTYLGSVLMMKELADAAHAVGALFIAVVDPVSLALLAPPGEYGADIAVGEGQNLGGWMSYGGPYLGFIATTEKHQRRLPGRIAGASVDDKNRPAYTLTLQTREQHIRRERATSNICTNEALVALGATVYLALLGKDGLSKVANLALQKAHYAAQQIAQVPMFALLNEGPFFREFVVKTPVSAAEVNQFLLARDIIGGIDLSAMFPDSAELHDCLLLACTDQTSKGDIDDLVHALKDLVGGAAPAPVPEGVA